LALALLCASVGARSQDGAYESNRLALWAAGVIPDILDDFSPNNLIKLIFSRGAVANFGNEIKPADVFDGIKGIIWLTDPGALYTLAVVDPDVPSRADPGWRSFAHYLVGNIQGRNITDFSETIWGFIGCGPTQGSGFHRYTYILFKQPAGFIDFSAIVHRSSRNADGRGQFNVRDFAKTFGLGAPIAANYFLAQYDDSVPKLYAGLTEHDPKPPSP